MSDEVTPNVVANARHLLSQLRPDLRRLYAEAGSNSGYGSNPDFRKYADGLIRCVFASADDPFTFGRYWLAHHYCDILNQNPSIWNKSDRKNLQKIMNDEKEPALFRTRATFQLALFYVPTDHELAVDYFRQVAERASQADPKDAHHLLFVPRTADSNPDGRHMTISAGEELKVLVSRGQLNIRLFENPHETANDPIVQEMMAKQSRQNSGTTENEENKFTIPSRAVIPSLLYRAPELLQRLELGGSKCDCCGKTLQELGVTRLSCCSLCKMAYYCSPTCQRKQWRAGHKEACRKPGMIKSNDVMELRGLQARPELNNSVVMVRRKDPSQDARWVVLAPDGPFREKEISIAADKLFRIRPAK